MRTVQPGDHVHVHYAKHFPGGVTTSTRHRGTPVAVTVGQAHPRLPGLGLALVGLRPGGRVTLTVPAGQAHPPADPARVRRLAAARFPGGHAPAPGEWGWVRDRRGRRHRVRVVEARGPVVVVDTNHPGAGQPMELDVELVAFCGPDAQPAGGAT